MEREEGLSVQALMMPRYKVIALFPDITYKVGDLLEKETYFDGVEQYHYRDYPHIFRKLDWWQDRKPEEMPKYIQYDGEVRKVIKFKVWKGSIPEVIVTLNKPFGDYDKEHIDVIDGVKPATEAEYIAYTQQNKPV